MLDKEFKSQLVMDQSAQEECNQTENSPINY